MSPKYLIVDDEEAACKVLRSKIREMDSAPSIEYETNPLEALKKIESWKPDLLFLDIQMPDLDGFELLEQIPLEKRSFALVFCTAYSEFAIKAFEAAALDYLLKPVEPERLRKALERARPPDPEVTKELLPEPFLKRIHLKVGSDHRLVGVDEVECFFSESHETIALVEGREYFCDLSLNRLEEKLNPDRFVRIHRSSLANLNWVKSMEASASEIVMVSGKVLSLAKRSKGNFIKRFKALGK